MTRFLCGVAAMVLVVAAGSDVGRADDKKGDPKKGDGVAGTVWDFKATKIGSKGSEVIEEGQFHAEDFKIFRGGVQVGTYSKVGNQQFKLDITKGKLKGVITIKLTGHAGPQKHEVYNGEWEMAGGGKAHMRVEFRR